MDKLSVYVLKFPVFVKDEGVCPKQTLILTLEHNMHTFLRIKMKTVKKKIDLTQQLSVKVAGPWGSTFVFL